MNLRSSSFSKVLSYSLSLFLVFQSIPLSADGTKPFQVLGSVQIPEGRWNEVPDLILKLSSDVQSAPIQFELIASAAEQYFVQGLWDESSKAFQKLAKARKPSPSLFLRQMRDLRLAEIALLEGEADAALARLVALTKDSNPYMAEEAIFLQARCFLAKHDWDNLDRTVTKLVRQNKAYAEDLILNLMQGVASLEQGHIDQAMAYFKHFPDEPSALYYLAICFIQKKEIANALPIYQQLLQKDPRSEWVDRMRLALGEAFYLNRDMTTSDEFLKQVTRPQVDPHVRILALHREACLYFQQKRFDECEKTLNYLLKAYPRHILRSQWTYLYASIPIFKKDWKKSIQEQKAAFDEERGIAPNIHGVDITQLRLSAQFRILWAHLLLNDYSGTQTLADRFIARYPKEQMTSYAYLAKGMAYYRLADYDKALETYQELLNRYPQSSACGKAVYLMTLCLHSARDPFRMAGVLNEVHQRMQNADTKGVDEWTQNTLYWVADAYFQLNDFNSAEKIYREFLSRAPQSPLVPYALEALGGVLSAQGPQRDDEAVVAMQQAQLRARDLDNKNLAEQVEVELAKIFYNQRNFSKAAATWSHVVLVSTQPYVRAEAIYRQGDALTRQDYYQEAIKHWKSLVRQYKQDKKNPWVPEALKRIGTTQAGLGSWAEASETFRFLKEGYPGTESAKEAAFQLEQCTFNQGNIPQAVTELIAFANKYPDDPRIPKAADNLLSAFHAKKVVVPPTQQVQLLKLAPGSAGGAALLWEKGAALFNQGKYEPAQKIFEKIMLSYPNDEYAPMSYFYNADCFYWMQRWEDAANAYQNFFLSFPKHERVPNAMYQKSLALFRKGDYNDAVTDFQAFLNKFPNHPLAKEAWLNIALSHKKAFQLDQAVKAYQYVIEHFPNDPKVNAVWLQMGALLDVQGKRAEAIKAYSKIPEIAVEYPEAVYRESLLCEQDRNMGAVRRLLEALRSWPEKHNEFRLNALIKLSEVYEQDGAPAPKLKALYEDIKVSTNNPEIAQQAAQRVKELSQ